MTAVIDEKGNLFGYVNIIDFLVLLVVVALVVAGVAFISGSGEPTPTNQQFRFEATVVASQAEAIHSRQPYGGEVVAIEAAEVIGHGTNWRDGQQVAVTDIRLVVTLPVTQTDDGYLQYQSERLLIGEKYELDLGFTIIEATLIGDAEADT